MKNAKETMLKMPEYTFSIEEIPNKMIAKYAKKYFSKKSLRRCAADISVYECLQACRDYEPVTIINASLVLISLDRIARTLAGKKQTAGDVERVVFNMFSDDDLADAFKSDLWYYEYPQLISYCRKGQDLLLRVALMEEQPEEEPELLMSSVMLLKSIEMLMCESFKEYATMLNNQKTAA